MFKSKYFCQYRCTQTQWIFQVYFTVQKLEPKFRQSLSSHEDLHFVKFSYQCSSEIQQSFDIWLHCIPSKNCWNITRCFAFSCYMDFQEKQKLHHSVWINSISDWWWKSEVSLKTFRRFRKSQIILISRLLMICIRPPRTRTCM